MGGSDDNHRVFHRSGMYLSPANPRAYGLAFAGVGRSSTIIIGTTGGTNEIHAILVTILKLKLKFIYNNTTKLNRLSSNGHRSLKDFGHLRAKIGPDGGCSLTGYTYRHTYMQCAPKFLGG
jgi:hypothetical protein